MLYVVLLFTRLHIAGCTKANFGATIGEQGDGLSWGTCPGVYSDLANHLYCMADGQCLGN